MSTYIKLKREALSLGIPEKYLPHVFCFPFKMDFTDQDVPEEAWALLSLLQTTQCFDEQTLLIRLSDNIGSSVYFTATESNFLSKLSDSLISYRLKFPDKTPEIFVFTYRTQVWKSLCEVYGRRCYLTSSLQGKGLWAFLQKAYAQDSPRKNQDIPFYQRILCYLDSSLTFYFPKPDSE